MLSGHGSRRSTLPTRLWEARGSSGRRSKLALGNGAVEAPQVLVPVLPTGAASVQGTPLRGVPASLLSPPTAWTTIVGLLYHTVHYYLDNIPPASTR